jgi:hypothetical protein
MLEHDPEKWIPVFGKDYVPTKGKKRRAAGLRSAGVKGYNAAWDDVV